jgi:hypothetical protein
MFDVGSFDVEHCIISKTVAKSAGIVSERTVRLFFRKLTGCPSWDLWHNNNGTIVEWSNEWNIIDNISRHTLFCIMPVHCVPVEILATRLARFDTMRSMPIIRSDINVKDWFDNHTKNLTGEDDLMFEHRLIKTLIAIFRVIQKRNAVANNP